MTSTSVQAALKEIENRLAIVGELPAEVETSVRQLLNVVEALSSDKQSLIDEVQRLKEQLDKKKRTKFTHSADDDKQHTDHSSEKHRR